MGKILLAEPKDGGEQWDPRPQVPPQGESENEAGASLGVKKKIKITPTLKTLTEAELLEHE